MSPVTIPLQSSIVYGPIRSRRFGTSLGINLLPADQKVCNLDCIYCQYSPSPESHHTGFPTIAEIESETAARLDQIRREGLPLDCLTLAGNGEPTIHPQFAEAVDALIAVRDRCAPGVPIHILSNSTTCHRPKIRTALQRLDGRYMKLDAGGRELFGTVNRPAGDIAWARMIDGLSYLEGIVLQSLFFEGKGSNTNPEDVAEWIRVVACLRPTGVQIYTIDRPTHEEGLTAASACTLTSIASKLFAKTGIRGTVFEPNINGKES
jgi:wyosine [tRNA(Phe)-imidazoG37] synthetase (radical SAM superfamily)